MSNDLLSYLDRALRFAEQAVATVTDDLREGATPCPDFTVTQLVSHLASCTRWYARIPADGVSDPAALSDDDLTGRDLTATLREVADLARAAWRPEGLSRVFPAPFGDITGTEMTGYMVMELLGHGLDIVLATGTDLRPDEDLLSVAAKVAQGMGDALRRPGMMGPEVLVSAGAPPEDRFLGLIGRDPAWTPAR
jgi:uncharacterized protein (TIGR03086 family)